MSKSRSKGYIYGTPICIKGGGGSWTIGIPDSVGTHKSRATARRPPSREAATGATCPRSGLWHFCNTVSTMQQSTVPGPRPAKRARRRESRAAAIEGGRPRSGRGPSTPGAQPMRVQRRRACDTMSHWHIAFRWSRFVDREEIYLSIDLTIIMG